jgi:LytS/YehU family sensor histidine kinase
MRMRYPLSVSFREVGKLENIVLPPQLLIPLVENVFKHGIDKRRNDNFIHLSIEHTSQRLEVIVENRLTGQGDAPASNSGTGIRNLRSRLSLLYAKDYLLQSGPVGEHYRAILNIPCE